MNHLECSGGQTQVEAQKRKDSVNYSSKQLSKDAQQPIMNSLNYFHKRHLENHNPCSYEEKQAISTKVNILGCIDYSENYLDKNDDKTYEKSQLQTPETIQKKIKDIFSDLSNHASFLESERQNRKKYQSQQLLLSHKDSYLIINKQTEKLNLYGELLADKQLEIRALKNQNSQAKKLLISQQECIQDLSKQNQTLKDQFNSRSIKQNSQFETEQLKQVIASLQTAIDNLHKAQLKEEIKLSQDNVAQYRRQIEQILYNLNVHEQQLLQHSTAKESILHFDVLKESNSQSFHINILESVCHTILNKYHSLKEQFNLQNLKYKHLKLKSNYDEFKKRQLYEICKDRQERFQLCRKISDFIKNINICQNCSMKDTTYQQWSQNNTKRCLIGDQFRSEKQTFMNKSFDEMKLPDQMQPTATNLENYPLNNAEKQYNQIESQQQYSRESENKQISSIDKNNQQDPKYQQTQIITGIVQQEDNQDVSKESHCQQQSKSPLSHSDNQKSKQQTINNNNNNVIDKKDDINDNIGNNSDNDSSRESSSSKQQSQSSQQYQVDIFSDEFDREFMLKYYQKHPEQLKNQVNQQQQQITRIKQIECNSHQQQTQQTENKKESLQNIDKSTHIKGIQQNEVQSIKDKQSNKQRYNFGKPTIQNNRQLLEQYMKQISAKYHGGLLQEQLNNFQLLAKNTVEKFDRKSTEQQQEQIGDREQISNNCQQIKQQYNIVEDNKDVHISCSQPLTIVDQNCEHNMPYKSEIQNQNQQSLQHQLHQLNNSQSEQNHNQNKYNLESNKSNAEQLSLIEEEEQYQIVQQQHEKENYIESCQHQTKQKDVEIPKQSRYNQEKVGSQKHKQEKEDKQGEEQNDHAKKQRNESQNQTHREQGKVNQNNQSGQQNNDGEQNNGQNQNVQDKADDEDDEDDEDKNQDGEDQEDGQDEEEQQQGSQDEDSSQQTQAQKKMKAFDLQLRAETLRYQSLKEQRNSKWKKNDNNKQRDKNKRKW